MIEAVLGSVELRALSDQRREKRRHSPALTTSQRIEKKANDQQPTTVFTPAQPSCVTGTSEQWRTAGASEDSRAVRRAGSRDRFQWSSSSYRKRRSSCGTKPDVLPVQPWSGCPSRRQGNRSVRGETQSISLVAISTAWFLRPIRLLSLLKKFIQPLAQL